MTNHPYGAPYIPSHNAQSSYYAKTSVTKGPRIELKYVDAQDIIDEVKNSLSHYFSSGKLDMSIYPRVIRSIVGRISRRRGKIQPLKSTVLTLSNFQAELPDDFDRVVLAMMCSKGTVYVKNPLKSEVSQVIVKELNLCEGKYSVCTDSCGRMTKLIEKTEYDPFQYEEFFVLKPSESSYTWCDKECFGLSRSANPNSFEIREMRGHGSKKIFYSAVETGKVYLEYRSLLEQEDGFMIPDVPQIRDWVYAALMAESFKHLWYRGEEVQGRLQLAERELFVKKEEAEVVIAMPEVYELYEMTHSLSNRFQAMSQWVGVDNCYRPRG